MLLLHAVGIEHLTTAGAIMTDPLAKKYHRVESFHDRDYGTAFNVALSAKCIGVTRHIITASSATPNGPSWMVR